MEEANEILARLEVATERIKAAASVLDSAAVPSERVWRRSDWEHRSSMLLEERIAWLARSAADAERLRDAALADFDAARAEVESLKRDLAELTVRSREQHTALCRALNGAECARAHADLSRDPSPMAEGGVTIGNPT